MTEQGPVLPMSPYRVLDLTQGGCLIGPRLLGDVGADVIKIEHPRGDPSRNEGPFYKDIPHPEKSLFWFTYCCNKRGITLDIETADGREILKKLVKTADFLIESYPVGYMDSLGLSYDELSAVNPRIIVTSITPFGYDGPKSWFKGSDLTGWASGGTLYTMGDPDRAPNWIGFGPQATLHGGAEAAAASMIAHWHRELTGEGQWVDVSIQQVVAWILQCTIQAWEMNKFDYPRSGSQQVTASGVGRRQVYPCKDGFVSYMLMGGGLVNVVASTRAVVKWMDEEGMAPDWLKAYNWERDFDTSKLTREIVDRVEVPFLKFFATKTKADLWEQCRKRGIILAPVNSVEDLCRDPHLEVRDFWEKVYHPELNDTLTYCGPFYRFSKTPVKIRRRAPLIGEHNDEVYGKELGMSKNEMALLKEAGAI
ncbi:MAG: CoA transferase [Dehalococcoidia bacterium]|nr:CoA transferase [Dehalococcoidia bacterium]